MRGDLPEALAASERAHIDRWAALLDVPGGREPLALHDLRSKALSTDQVLLEYLVSRDSTLVFLVAQDRCRAFVVGAGEDSLRALVDEMEAAIGRGEAISPVFARLHALLLDPVLGDLAPGARLVIVGDGPLHRLPFAALHDGKSFLVERHALALVPSASVLDPARPSRRPRRGAARELLTVGLEAPLAAAALFARSRTLADSAVAAAGLRVAVAGATHVHLAMPAAMSDEDPLASGLRPSFPSSRGAPAKDGFLRASGIVAWGMDADLVVLPACDRVGAPRRGEGLLVFSRALLQSRAAAAILSLRAAAPEAAGELMEAMYAGAIGRHLPPDVALQKAQQTALASGRPPRDWAAFVAIGRMRAPRADGRFPAWLVLAGLGVAAAGIAVAFRVSRTRTA